MQKIILASQSPRRKQLLEWAEIPFDVMVSDIDESFDASMSFEEAAIHIAHNKAKAIAEKVGMVQPILAADTVVVCNKQFLGKPVDEEEAVTFLKMLAGNTHQVITGVAILFESQQILFADTTEVSFHSLSEIEIQHYVKKYKPYDKAGAYAIQEWIGVVGIASVNGDFYNVMGLPISRVVQCLKAL
ncbi:MAG: Maf family protein [Ferruginibacter sp.]